MANITEVEQWDDGVYQLETTDPVQGGADGIDNLPHKHLANRTLWLKNAIENLGTTLATVFASLGGSATQKFKVADAVANDEAISKSQLMGLDIKYENNIIKDQSGNPIFNKAVAFNVGYNSDGYKTVGSGNWYAIPFDNVAFDTHNSVTASADSGKWVCPKSGYYMLHMWATYNGAFNSNHTQLRWTNLTDGLKVFNTKISPYDSMTTSLGLYRRIQKTTIAYIEEGCELQAQSYQDSGANQTIRRSMCGGSGFLIGVDNV